MDDNWFFRNRVRDTIFHGVHALRALQLASGIRTSQVFRIIAKVYRDTDDVVATYHLNYLIFQLERDEMRNRNR